MYLALKALIHVLGIVISSSLIWLVMRVHAPLQWLLVEPPFWGCDAEQHSFHIKLANKPWQYPTAETPSRWIPLGLKVESHLRTGISPNASKWSREHLPLCMQCFAGCRMWTVLYLEWTCWHRWAYLKWLLLSLLLHKLKRVLWYQLEPEKTLPTL